MEKRRILVIDDDRRSCETMTTILADASFDVLSAPDGLTGIETARETKPTLILLDMMMPGLDGIGTCERLKGDPVLNNIPVIGITGSSDLKYTEKAFRAGAQFFLPKPFGMESLVQIVQLALESTQSDTAMDRHRPHPRFPAELLVWCLVGSDPDTTRKVMGHTQNLSLSGLLVLLPGRLEPGTVLRLCLGLPQGRITADGVVMWQAPKPTDEGKTPHGIRLLRFEEGAGLVQYRRYLSQIATGHAARTSTVVRYSNDAITVQDLDGNILAWNRGAERMYGWTEDEALEMNIRTIIPEPERESALILAQRITQEEVSESYEAQRVTKDGRLLEVWVTASLLVEDTGNPTAIATTERDISDRKRAQEALARHAEDLARANTDLEQFAYVASHDLQEPLRMVASYVQLLQKRYKGKLDVDADEFIAYAVDGATRMQDLINDLLAYSRIGTQGKDFESTDSKSSLDQALVNLRSVMKESGAVVTHDPLPTVMGDAIQLGQVFQNLIGNAIKFRGEQPPEVHVGGERKDGEWLFSVRDNGIGIDMQYAERIFVMFESLHSKADYAGTGIGLSLCKRIVERHGGRIWLESELGKGATFYFTIPDKVNE